MVARFFPREDGTVVCEIDAPSPEAFKRWVAEIGYVCCKGEAEAVGET